MRRALEELEKRGATYDDILSGEIGTRWIQESCGGDLELAKAAYELQHPGAHFIRMPKGL